MENNSVVALALVITGMFLVAYKWRKPFATPTGVNELIGGTSGNTDKIIKPPIILIYDDFQIFNSVDYLLTYIEEWQFDRELAIDANGQIITFRLENDRHTISYSVINPVLLGAVLEAMCLNRGLTPEEIDKMENQEMYEILKNI